MTLSASHLGWGLGASDVRNFTHVSDSTIKDVVSDWPLVENIMCNFTWTRNALLMSHVNLVPYNPKSKKYKFLAPSK